MYFPALERSSIYNEQDAEILQNIDNALYLIYENNYHRRFNPRVYKYFDFELDEAKWIEILEKLVRDNYLIKNLELCCDICDETIETFHALDELPVGIEKSCPNCGTNFFVRYADIFITYAFNEILEPRSKKESEEFFRNNTKTIKGNEKFSVETLLFYPHNIYKEVILERKKQLEDILPKLINEYNGKDKGNIFESLACDLLRSPYLRYHSRNKRTPTGEIDLIFIVNKIQNTLFSNFSNILIVECKNWEEKADAPQVRTFISKIEDVKSNVGIIFSKNGITGNYNHGTDGKGVIKSKWIDKEVLVLEFNINDITDIISNKKSVYEILEQRFYELSLSI
jgi:hypothetical protein